MKQGGGEGAAKVSKSTIAFSNASDALQHAVASDLQRDTADTKDDLTKAPPNSAVAPDAQADTDSPPRSRSDQPFAKSGLRKRSPIGSGRVVERLGSYVVEKRLAATEGTDIYRCVHALNGEYVLAKVLRTLDNYNERMRFDRQLASLEIGKLDGVKFISRGKCAVGPYFLVVDGGDDVIDRLLA